MTKLLLWLNTILLLGGLGVIYYIIVKNNPTEVNIAFVWGLIVAFSVIIWSITAFIGYGVRLFLFRNKTTRPSYLLMRSQRQGLIFGLLFGLHLALQGFLLWNVFSATILTIAVFVLEFFFIAQETK
jgi:uncharacterized protein YacL